MRLARCVLLLVAAQLSAQQTIYWKKDHIYVGGKEVAIVTPAPSDQTVPTTPTGAGQSNLTATSVQLSWSASTDSGGSGLAGYKVYRRVGTGASLPVGTVGTGVLTFTDRGLLPSTAYNWTIVAFDQAQNHSTPSSTVSATTSATSTDVTNPDAPAGLQGRGLTRQSTYKVRLDWNAATDSGGSGVAGYEVFRNDVLISGGSPITTLYYEDTTSTANTSFTYKIKSVDGRGNRSAFSSALPVTTLRELILSDDFNRANESGTGYRVQSNTLEVVEPDLEDWDQGLETSGISNFRASVLLLNCDNDGRTGISIWRSSTHKYLAYQDGSNLYLRYWDGSQLVSVASGGSVGEDHGTLTVEGTSSSRRIKVYWNGVLKIDFTETNTSRPNSGYVGLVSYAEELTAVLRFDNFLLER